MTNTRIHAHRVAENLRMALKHADITQSELGRKAGVARTTIHFAVQTDQDKARIPLAYSLCPMFEVLRERVPWLTLEMILMGKVPKTKPRSHT